MNHHTTANFWDEFDRLPAEVQRAARRAFDHLKADPSHPSLHFMKVQGGWSFALAFTIARWAHRTATTSLWDWIGPHSDYDGFLDAGE